ncbi:hypothetical protein DWV22_05720 [Weissella confusa]|uniref:hypothetical protein n=1 Tax=Weissella confusa TaxID=1583 RepID=UPI000E4EE6E4|nr:hypothetical protein [Weissella confusa]MBJ7620702.1 hypothetical protein [Weissella confusa]MBJ7667542.1 hypothetical protein [Weissella confusa]MBJ7678805.1 hypothetical protein [Weissella confusa]MCT0019100.1 hypothetical protein [Weissella confusa]MCT0039912.1 hypothetical protein [Weissella confusa]
MARKMSEKSVAISNAAQTAPASNVITDDSSLKESTKKYIELRKKKYNTLESLYAVTKISMLKLSNFENEKEKPSLIEFSKLMVALEVPDDEVKSLATLWHVDFSKYDYRRIATITWDQIKELAEDGRRVTSIGVALLPRAKSFEAQAIIEQVIVESGHTVQELDDIIEASRNKLRTAHLDVVTNTNDSNNRTYPKKSNQEYVHEMSNFMFEEDIASMYGVSVNKLRKSVGDEAVINLIPKKSGRELPYREQRESVVKLLRTGRSIENIARRFSIDDKLLLKQLSVNTGSEAERNEMKDKGIALFAPDIVAANHLKDVLLQGGTVEDTMLDLQTDYYRLKRLVYVYSGLQLDDFEQKVRAGVKIERKGVSDERSKDNKAEVISVEHAAKETTIPMKPQPRSNNTSQKPASTKKRTVQKHIRPAFEHGETDVQNLKRFFSENPQMGEMDRMNYALASELFTDFSEIGKPLRIPEGLVKMVLTREDKSEFYYDKIQNFLYSQAAERGFDMGHLEKYK